MHFTQFHLSAPYERIGIPSLANLIRISKQHLEIIYTIVRNSCLA